MIFRDFFKTVADLIKKYKMPFFLFLLFSPFQCYICTHTHTLPKVYTFYLFI